MSEGREQRTGTSGLNTLAATAESTELEQRQRSGHGGVRFRASCTADAGRESHRNDGISLGTRTRRTPRARRSTDPIENEDVWPAAKLQHRRDLSPHLDPRQHALIRLYLSDVYEQERAREESGRGDRIVGQIDRKSVV